MRLVIRTCGLRKVNGLLYLNKGRKSGINDLVVDVCTFCVLKTGMSAMRDRLLYEFPLCAPVSDVARGNSPQSVDTGFSVRINGVLSDSLSSYYDKTNFTDKNTLWLISFIDRIDAQWGLGK